MAGNGKKQDEPEKLQHLRLSKMQQQQLNREGIIHIFKQSLHKQTNQFPNSEYRCTFFLTINITSKIDNKNKIATV